MRLKITNWLIGLSLLSCLVACSDHLGPLTSPDRLRLKTTLGNSINSSYTYDGQNRLATITSGNQLTVYTYDDAKKTSQLYQYPNSADLKNGSAAYLPYTITGLTSFTVLTQGIINSSPFGIVSTEIYSVDSNGHIIYVLRGPGRLDPPQLIRGFDYNYTGENITTGTASVFHDQPFISVYEYDTKINPFYGSTDPGLNDTQRFSRNNITKITTSRRGTADQIVTYQYEYNQQNLPTKRTTIHGGTDVLTYTYESY